jgi:hypothetical protein
MRKALILLVLLFAIGVSVLAPTQAQVSNRRNPCVRRCREEFKSAREACRHLPPAERRECERSAKDRFQACVRNCR